MSFIRRVIIICLIMFIAALNAVTPQSQKKGEGNNLKSVSVNPSRTKININNISDWVSNNGDMDATPNVDAGFVYPKGSGKTAYFESGLLWGGMIDDYWAVGGSAYRHGIIPGRILADGTAENSNMASVRIFRVRSDYKNFTTDDEMRTLYADEIADEGKTAEEIFARYDLDWKEWPAQYGAPYIDKDGNGLFNPNIDVPGVSEEPCQTVWYVANDLDAAATRYLYGALPMKVEMQATFFAFKPGGAIGNTIFKKYKLINKNSKQISHMYFIMWSDPDLGTPFDDRAGCDTLLNLGYVYNANVTDGVYGTTPPATGFVILRGPVVPASTSDSGYVNGRRKYGFKNLGMTAFSSFTAGETADMSDPTQGVYSTGALAWKNIAEGKFSRSGVPYNDPTTQRVTRFLYSGDPVMGTGWLDPSPGNDHRMSLSAGPFSMNPGDTQEIVFGQLIAGGTPGINRLNAISVLKFYTGTVQKVYDGVCMPTPPPAPVVKASEMDNSVILSWSDPGSFESVENYNRGGLKFQGYNIYQLPGSNATMSSAERITAYDLVDGISTIYSPSIDPVSGTTVSKITAYGTDNGISRYITISKDYIKGIPVLYSGTDYYFAVTSYVYNPDKNAVPNFLESPLRIIKVTPQSINPGVRLTVAVGDTLAVNHTAGISEGKIQVKIIDPKSGDGKEYTVTMPDENHYNILNGTTVIYANKLITGAASDNPIIGGAQINIFPASGTGLKSSVASRGSNPWDESGAGLWFTGSGYPNLWNGGLQIGYGWWYNGAYGVPFKGSSLTSYSQFHDVVIKMATTDDKGALSSADANASMGYRYMRYADFAAAQPSFAPFIKNNLNFGFQEFGLNNGPNIPLAVYDQVTGKRLDVGCLENNVAAGIVDGLYFPPLAYSQGGTGNSTAREVLFIFNTEYKSVVRTEFSQPDREILYSTKYGPLPIMYWVSASRVKRAFSSDDEITIRAYKVFSTDDVYKFTIPAPAATSDFAKEDVNKINVYPNPYYGLDPDALSSSDAKITFTHLPSRVIIKIFNISGQLIRTINKDGAGQFQVWDLKTDGGMRVASGVYVAHIELPDIGTVKTLKFAIIQGQRYKTGF